LQRETGGSNFQSAVQMGLDRNAGSGIFWVGGEVI